MTNEIKYRAEIGIDGEAIIVAECGDAAAVYDVKAGSYMLDGDDDQCPATEDGCWPAPPADLLAEEKPQFYLVPDNADFFNVDFAGRVFGSKQEADAFALRAYLGPDVNGQTSSWEIKPVPESIDQWADRYERAAYLAV